MSLLPANVRMFIYWKGRARTLGRRSVLNSAHDEGHFESVTSFQKSEIFPFLRQKLNGTEKVCLDYGCGPGRFTADLAHLIEGRSIGVDPIRELIELAPPSDNVEYHVMKNGEIPLPDNSVDIVWCCLVLGGIPDSLLSSTARNIVRVLNEHGLLVLVENTAEKPSQQYWSFRSVEMYRNLFPDFQLDRVHEYSDIGETISVMMGRKKAQRAT